MDPNRHLTPNFKLGEFFSPDGVELTIEESRNIEALANRLQVIRDLIESPLTITSGHRSKSHNQKVGGSPSSYHVRGMACDIPKHQLPKWLQTRLWKSWNGGMGRYSSHIHLDIGPKRRWESS